MAKKTPTISQQLRDAIKTAEAAGVTRYVISHKSGVTQSTLSRFMAGQRDPSLTNVDRICLTLGLTLMKAEQRR